MLLVVLLSAAQCVSVVHSTDSNSYRNSNYTCQQRRATISDVTDTDVTEHNSDDDDSAGTSDPLTHEDAHLQQQQQSQQQHHSEHSNSNSNSSSSAYSGTVSGDRAMLSPTH
jgi:hypothetical protein